MESNMTDSGTTSAGASPTATRAGAWTRAWPRCASKPKPRAKAKPRKPAKVKKVRLKKPTLVNGRAGFTIKWKRAARARNYKVKWWPVPKTGARKDKTRG